MATDFYHGIGAAKQSSGTITPVTAASGVIFAVGKAPAHAAGGSVNKVIMASTYEEAVAAMGYSDDWEKYPLCALIYKAFKCYAVSPLFLVNILDPERHVTTATGKFAVNDDNQILLPLEALADKISIDGLEAGTDYEAFYSDAYCVVEFTSAQSGELDVSYSAVDPSAPTRKDAVGGVDVTTHEVTGLELIDSVLPAYGTVPDLILCPGFSQDSEVAAVMSAKAASINGLFEGTAVIDADAESVTYYQDVPAWKEKNNLTAANEIVCWPMLSLGGKISPFSIDQACLMSQVDNDADYGNGTPAESASNKKLQADSAVLSDGTEVTLDGEKGNYLNKQGIVTAIRFLNGFTSWGDWTAIYPASTDATEYFYSESRMFKYVAQTAIRTFWPHIDRNMTRRLADAILAAMNSWLEGLTAQGLIYGGRIELPDAENTAETLMQGHLTFRIYLGTVPPLVWQQYYVEYDSSYIEAAFS